MIKSTFISLLICIAVISCKDDQGRTDGPAPAVSVTASQELAQQFPLLPLVEKTLWRQLLDSEEIANNIDSPAQQRVTAKAEIDRISAKLNQKHPFKSEQQCITLGGISYNKNTGQISIPAVVNYPRKNDDLHPDELELILCSTMGRSHETLFMSQARPLHLELLMHLAGYKKSSPISEFKVEVLIDGQAAIPIENLIRSISKDKLPERLVWEFSGSDFNDLYPPDQTGDFIILWHAHDSVMRVQHEKIASGEIKLAVKKHIHLKQGQAVMLVLSPLDQ